MPSSVETLRKELTRQPASQCRVSSLVIFMGDLQLGSSCAAPRLPPTPAAMQDGRVAVDIAGGQAYLRPTVKCPGGGIGRRAGFRYLWQQCRGSSSLLLGTTLPAGLTPCHTHCGRAEPSRSYWQITASSQLAAWLPKNA